MKYDGFCFHIYAKLSQILKKNISKLLQQFFLREHTILVIPSTALIFLLIVTFSFGISLALTSQQ